MKFEEVIQLNIGFSSHLQAFPTPRSAVINDNLQHFLYWPIIIHSLSIYAAIEEI